MGTLGQETTHSQNPAGLVGPRTPPLALELVTHPGKFSTCARSGYNVLTKEQNGRICKETPENDGSVSNRDRPASSCGRRLSYLPGHTRQIQVHEVRGLHWPPQAWID